MKLNIIKTEEDYNQAMIDIDNLIDAPTGSDDAETLEILSLLVEDYENKHYKIESPDPIEAIKERVCELGLTRKDLEKSIGSRGRVSEILNKKRKLSLAMIRKLNENLNIPADILIKNINTKTA